MSLLRMRRTSGMAALALGVLLAIPSAQAGQSPVSPVSARLRIPSEPASVTSPQDPVVLDGAASASTGWRGSAAVTESAPELSDGLVMAYTRAVAMAPTRCHLPVTLLAAIAQVESGNAAGHTLGADHRVTPAIIGPALDGSKYAAMPDTDGGTLDGDPVWDHAIGPFQFIPSSWRAAGVDLDGDGSRDPQDVYDAAGAAMVYLCSDERDLDDQAQLEQAVFSYNHSADYVRRVLAWKKVFDEDGLWNTDTEPIFAARPRTVSVTAPHAPTRPATVRHQVAAAPVSPSPSPGPLLPVPTTSPTDPTGPADPTSPGECPTPTAPTTTDPAEPTPTDPVTEPSADPTASPTDPTDPTPPTDGCTTPTTGPTTEPTPTGDPTGVAP